MINYVYMTNPARIKAFLDTIQAAGVPDKFNRQTLEGFGFKSKNDRPLIPMMKSLGFISDSGVATERWQQYRNKKNAGTVLAQGIREHYAELFKMYPDAHNRDTEALHNFFSSHTKVAASTLDLMVRTFKTLCAIGDFDSEPQASDPAGAVMEKSTVATETVNKSVITTAGHVININIQLTMPATDDPKTYELFFAAMKKHLLS